MPVFNDFFGQFGGRFVAEVLRAPLEELENAFITAMGDPNFLNELAQIQKEYIGRPTPLLPARNASKLLGGAQIYIKLEGLANTGAHKINNAVGQVLLARRMGKTRIIAETGAGQHGVATAAVCAKFGLPCRIYMGEVDIRRQRPNVFLMELYGAEVVSVKSGSQTLKDAVNEALRDWSGSFPDTHYLLGSALGPSPFPDMVREFQAVIGREVAQQTQDLNVAAMIACVGGGSNSIGFFEPFLDKPRPRLIGVEAGGRGPGHGQNAVRMSGEGRPGIVQGYKSFFLLDDDGQVMDTHSVSAGLDYAGIGPQLAALGQTGRIEFTSASDTEVLDAVKFFARHEGVVFALESAHAGAVALKLAPTLPRDQALIVNMSGRGDKDIFISAKYINPEPWFQFLKDEVQRHES
ncbi:MAG: tryptophan synthase subunit beta [Spirochaetales bacterium]|nr:tryptophan synthase subunit beta [Spirochaetales bacterium]